MTFSTSKVQLLCLLNTQLKESKRFMTHYTLEAHER